jgi:hypothetical protein
MALSSPASRSEAEAREGDPELAARHEHASLRDIIIALDPLPLRRLRRLRPGMTACATKGDD